MDIDRETEVTTQTKGKGGALLSTTSAFFEARYRDAEDKETQVQQCLATDGRVHEDGDEDMMVTKTLIDGMEPEAHANAILATDFQEAGTFEDPELTAALKRMSISEDGSWQEADRFTEISEDTDPGWTKVRQADIATKEARYHGGAGAGSPAADKEGDPRSRSPPHTGSPGPQGRSRTWPKRLHPQPGDHRPSQEIHTRFEFVPTAQTGEAAANWGDGHVHSHVPTRELPAPERDGQAPHHGHDGEGVRQPLPPVQRGGTGHHRGAENPGGIQGPEKQRDDDEHHEAAPQEDRGQSRTRSETSP